MIKQEKVEKPAEDTILSRLGEDKCDDLVSKLLDVVIENEELCPYFKNHSSPDKFKLLKERKTKYIKFLLSGEAEWTGRDLKEMHMPLKINDAHFD